MNYDPYVLCHYGVKGMKWGVRRYQNYNGSYTREGLKRYNKALSNYNSSDEVYNKTKKYYKDTKKNGYAIADNGQKIAVSKNVKQQAKTVKRAAKKDLNDAYRQLSRDKKADKGKALYNSGKRIRTNNAVTYALSSIGALAVTEAVMGNYVSSSKARLALATIGSVLITSSTIKGLADEVQNSKLRAYYGHSRPTPRLS